MHLVGYLRVSFVGNRKADRFHSPEEQRQEIDGWAVPRGHTVDYLEPELDGKGTNPDRPILREGVDGIKAGRWEGFAVAYLSRAGRDLRLMLDLWDEVEAKEVGGTVFFARENIDGSTPHGRMQRNILASVGQYELEERREGFEKAAKGAVERGVWQRRQTPRGYVRDPDTRKLVVELKGAAEVRQAATDFLAGVTVVELSVRLGMTPGGVRAMLRNRVYLGELKVRSYVNSKAHPAILDQPIFEAVQEKLDAGRRPSRSPSPSLLAGVIRCRSCGFAMTRSGSGHGWTYRCSKFHSGAVCPAPAGISCGRVDGFVEAVALRELRNLSGRPTAVDGAKGAENELTAAEAELSAYLQAVDVAGIGSADAAAGMRGRRERVDAARERLNAELARVPRLPTAQVGDEIWETLTISERSDLLRSLFAAVVVAPAEGRQLPVSERLRIFSFGSDIGIPVGRRRDRTGNIPLPWPDLDDPRLVPVAGIEDAL